MRELLIRYLLGELDAEEQSQLEHRLHESAELRQELACLRRCFAENSDPERTAAEPPRGLAERTSERVASFAYGPEDVDLFDVASGRVAALAGAAEPPTGVLGWNLADFTVAAGVCLAMSMLLLPALRNSQDASRRNSCANHQRATYFVFAQYADRNGGRMPSVRPNEFAGMMFVRLVGDGDISLQDARRLLVCSGSPLGEAIRRGEAEIFIPSQLQIRIAPADSVADLFRTSTGSYAVPLPSLVNNRFTTTQLTESDDVPIFSDAPNLSVAGIESQNHYGGLNVLYSGGYVTFQTAAVAPRWQDRIFVNDHGLTAAGLRKHDTVLVPGDHTPDGIVATSSLPH